MIKTLSPSTQKWHEENGVIYFSVTSDGTAGEQWITRLASKGFRTNDGAKIILRSEDFKPTKGITYEIAVLRGVLFNDSDRNTKNIRAEADKRKFITPNAEVACLIREKFCDEELLDGMGLHWIIVMHEPTKESNNYPDLLRVTRYGWGWWLDIDYDFPQRRLFRSHGFAFVVPSR